MNRLTVRLTADDLKLKSQNRGGTDRKGNDANRGHESEGHGFSRAVNSPKYVRPLGPEVRLQGSTPFARSYLTHRTRQRRRSRRPPLPERPRQ